MGVLFEKWNSRIIAPLSVMTALVTVLLHSGLIELLRNSCETLYAVYAVIALVLLVVYFLTEPYIKRVWIDAVSRPAPADDAGGFAPVRPAPGIPDEDGDDILPLDTLTKRETEILPLVVQGYSNTDISKLLFISENTVKTHVKNIFQKLYVHSRFELAVRVNRTERSKLK